MGGGGERRGEECDTLYLTGLIMLDCQLSALYPASPQLVLELAAMPVRHPPCGNFVEGSEKPQSVGTVELFHFRKPLPVDFLTKDTTTVP